MNHHQSIRRPNDIPPILPKRNFRNPVQRAGRQPRKSYHTHRKRMINEEIISPLLSWTTIARATNLPFIAESMLAFHQPLARRVHISLFLSTFSDNSITPPKSANSSSPSNKSTYFKNVMISREDNTIPKIPNTVRKCD